MKLPALVTTGNVFRSQLKPLSKTSVSYKTVEVVERSSQEIIVSPLHTVAPDFNYTPKKRGASIVVATYQKNVDANNSSRQYAHLIDIYV
jgi:hypothetical protein